MKKQKQTDSFAKDIKETSKKEKPLHSLSAAFHSEVTPRVMGTFFVLLAVFLLFSFISFFVSWSLDYNIINSPADLLKGNKDTSNWGGPIGAFLSSIFIEKTFGVASFGYIFIFAIIGLKLFSIKINRFYFKILQTLAIMLWISILAGLIIYFAHLDAFLEFAGTVGISTASWLDGVGGIVGAIIFMLFFTITAPMVFFDVRYKFINNIINNRSSHIKKAKEPAQEASQTKETEAQTQSPIKEETQQEIKHTNQTSVISSPDLANTQEDTITADIAPATKIANDKKKSDDGLTEEEKATLLNFELKQQEAQRVQETISEQHSTPSTQEVPIQQPIQKENQDIQQTQSINPIPPLSTPANAPIEKVPEETDIPFEIEEKKEDAPTDDTEETDYTTDKENPETMVHHGIDTLYNPHEDLSSFQFPPTDFLINYEQNNVEVKNEELTKNKEKIVNTLKNYNIDISKIVATPGPTVTLYEIIPAPGIRISKIKNLEDDIALSLSALGIRIIAPIPGKGTIGIEVPNEHPQVVSMRSMINSAKFQNAKYELPIAIGKTISNEPYVTDLTKMPHLLMAGATGQGKSVGLNAIITSLLYKKHPSELKFVMVDPKKVELSLYNKIERHYLAKLPDSEEAIITDTRKVVRTLNSLCIEMDARYDLLKNAQVKNIKEYNPKFCQRRLNPEEGHHYMPYIVLVIDEFADLIMTAGKEIEMPIARLAQLARAVGIHLIIATQRPSVNIITGIIKANFPARIAFRVTSKIDSRTILDTGGADQLIGRGDMLLSTSNDLIRLQCALVDTEEIEKIGDFIGSQRGYPDCFLLPEYIDEDSEPSKEVDMRQLDEKFEEAARIIVALQHGSTSIIQRKLSLGYNRAGRIIDQLEAAGIVGPFEGSKAREVLIKDEVALNEILKEYLGKAE